MENRDYSQLELFTANHEGQKTRPLPPNTLFSFIRNYEKVVLVIIGLLITAVISFCFGVEKGKRLASAINNNRLQTASTESPKQTAPAAIETVAEANPNKTAAAAVVDNAQTQAKEQQKTETIKDTEEQAIIQNYTIQVASYKNKSVARKEAELLKRKGFSSAVLSKKGYSIVCIGTFTNRDKAKQVLTKLRKQYQDCYIRRL